MPPTIRWTCSLLLLAAALRAAPVLDPAAEGVLLNIHQARPCTDEGTREQDGRPARMLGWETAKQGWTEMTFATPQRRLLAPFQVFRRIRLSLDLWVPPEANVRTVALRLRDDESEVFQCYMPVESGPPGWRTLACEVDADTPPKGSWGGTKANKLLDQPIRLAGLAVSFADRGKGGRIGLGPVRMEILDAELVFSVDTGDPLFWVQPGRRPSLLASNAAIADRQSTIHVLLTGPHGEELLRRELSITVPAAGTARILELPEPERFGVYQLRCGPTPPRPSDRPQASYIHMKAAGPTAEPNKTFVFGMCDHLERYPREKQELIVLAAARCGVKLMRGSACWNLVQRTPDTWDFTEPDHQLDLLDRHGIAFEPIYSGNTLWAVAKDWQPVVEGRPGRGMRPDYDAWRAFIARYAERYRDRIPYVVVWNEPDLASFANFPPEDYVRLLKIAYETTKEHAPRIQVKTAGFSGLAAPHPSRSAAPKYLEAVLAQAKGYYDIFCIHLHGPSLRYHQRLQDMRRLRERLGDSTPWFSNETGITSIGRTSELDQAETLVRKFLTAWSHGASGYSWYNLYAKGRDPKDGEHNYGIITPDFHPKPAYAAYAALANLFADAQFVSVGGGDEYCLMLFRDRHGDWLLPHWSWSREPRSLFVAGIAGTATLLDIFGNETSAAPEGGTLMLRGQASPAILRISGQTNPPAPVGDPVQQEEEFVLFPGQVQSHAFALANRTAEPLEYRYRFVPQEGLSVVPESGQIRLGPGERAVLSAEFRAATDFGGRETVLDLVVGGQWHLALPRRLQHGVVLPSGDFPAEPQFVLDDKSQYRQLVPFAPGAQHLFWRGPEDLGGRAWLCRGDDGFRVRIEARDDVHAQPFRGADVFQGDNVQLGLHVPGQDRFWEVGLSRRDDGGSEVHVWSAPHGFDAAAAARQIRLETRRDEAAKTTVYVAELPFAALGADTADGRRRCRFNYLLNDCDDGKTREGYMQQFPGIGGEKSSRQFMQLSY